MRFARLNLDAYGRCKDVGIQIGDKVTVVVGTNEAGKSTSLDALGDLLWGIPPQSPRAIDFPRQQLRIGAALDLDGEIRTYTRKSTGLFGQDNPATPVSPPWDPDNALNRDWWRTRLGINRDDLREAGRKAFAGGGDIAEIIFAAREGRSAKVILQQISSRIDELYRGDRRARNVALRLAQNKYETAASELQTQLTSADKVVSQRELVQSLAKKFFDAGEARDDAGRLLKTALEDQRVVDAVLRLNQARNELAAITAEGARLSPPEFVEYQDAKASLSQAARRADRLDTAIRAKRDEIASLSVNDQLLDDKATVDRLQPESQARIDELKRADQEFGPEAADATNQLRQLLRNVGVEVSDQIEEELANASVRRDHAATLDELADRVEELEQKQKQALEKCNKSLADLSSKGVTIDLSAARVPQVEAISELREKLSSVRDQVSTAQALLDAARRTTNELRSSAPNPVEPPSLTHGDVITARRDRDEHWRAIRRSWLNGEVPDADGRHTMATELENSVREADRAADEEASERSRVAAQDALSGAHVDGLEAAKAKEKSAHVAVKEISEECEGLESKWEALWSQSGVSPAPSTAISSAIADLIIAAHVAHREANFADQGLTELAQSWSRATEAVGLSGAQTTAAWRKQSEILAEIESIQITRSVLLNREADARRQWESFATEAVELLSRHGAAEGQKAISPSQIAQGLTKLSREVGEAVAAAAKRTAYLAEIEEKTASRAEAQQEIEEASGAIGRLAKAHGLDSDTELDILVERAQRASDPLDWEAEAYEAIRIDLDGGSDPVAAIDRLAGRDQISVDQSVDEAQARATGCGEETERILSELTTARNTLADFEEAPSAAEIEAEVAANQAAVALVTEEWAILTLQKKLLTTALEALGSSDTSPLLDHAGRILEKLTGGRFVALTAEDDGTTRKLVVIQADAERLGTEALSEGTIDQVFLALRLAAVAELHTERTANGEPALPLVLDDVLMAFDEVRTERALQVLADLSPGLQVIVFTHHQFVGEAVAQSEWATVSRLPAPSPIESSIDGKQLRIKIQRDVLSGAAG
jgi:hypothetical protein